MAFLSLLTGGLLLVAVASCLASTSTTDFGVDSRVFDVGRESVLTAIAYKTRRSVFLMTNRRLLKLDETTLAVTGERKLHSRDNDPNLALLAVNQDQQLIECSKILPSFDLNCSMSTLDDLSLLVSENGARLVDNTKAAPVSSLVGVLAPLKAGYQALYVGIGVKNVQIPSTPMPPALSIRSVRSDSNFLITKPSMGVYYRTAEFSDTQQNYVGAMSINGFTYFFGVSRKLNENGGARATVSRVCQNDTEFRSYVETVLTCKRQDAVNDLVFDDLLSVYPAFVEASSGPQVLVTMTTSPFRSRDNQATTVCAVDWTRLNAHLDATVESCVLNGTSFFGLRKLRRYGDNNLKFTHANRCTKPQRSATVLRLSDDANEAAELLCGKYSSELNSPLRAFSAFPAQAVIDASDRGIAAIAADNRQKTTHISSENRNIRLFILWNSGEFQKFEILPSLSTRISATPITIARNIIGSPKSSKISLFFHSSHDFIFVTGASLNRLYQLPTANCGGSASTTCKSCLQTAADVDCGWCYSSSSCSTQGQCFGDRWVSKKDDNQQCVELSKILHSALSVEKTESQFQLYTIGGRKTLEKLSFNNFVCRFDGINVKTEGVSTRFGVRCSSPFRDASLRLLQGWLTTRLSLLAGDGTKTRAPFVLLQTPVTFYNCSSFSNCSACTSSKFDCQWCIKPLNGESSCQDFGNNKETCGTSKIISEHVDAPSTTSPSGPSFCPAITSPKMLVPAFVAHHLSVKVENFEHFNATLPSELSCQVNYDEKNVRLPATFVPSKKTVTCAVHEFNVTKAEVLGRLSLVFGKKSFGNTVPIQLFACELLSNDCSTCLSLQAKPRLAEYHCKWCSNQCRFSARCPIAADSHCTNIRITQVSPLKAPTEGNTTFTITGENLGYSFEQIRYGIRVATVPCNPVKELYQVSRKIVCTLASPTNGGEVSGPVEISFSESNQRIFSKQTVKIVQPSVDSFQPNRGPQSGGSRVTIFGKNLLIGNNVTVHIGDRGRLCSIDRERSTDSRLECITSPGQPGLEAPLLVAFDNRVFLHAGGKFRFTKDPELTHISPLASFASGGRFIYVHGKNFLSVKRPRIGVRFSQRLIDYPESTKKSSAPCFPKSDFLLVCRTPPLSANPQFLNLHSQILSTLNQQIASGHLYFEMDNVKSVEEPIRYFPKVASQIDYFTDPAFYHFSEDTPEESVPKLQIGSSLVMEGDNLNLAASESDFDVFVGEIPCNVTAISKKQLVCSIDEQQMAPFEHYTVRVTVGNLNFTIGLLQRFMPTKQAESGILGTINVEALIGCAIGFVLLLLTGTIFCCLLVRRSRQAKKNYEKVRFQLDSLESNVRTECKIAFAELQTEMGLVTGGGVSGSCGGAFSELTCANNPPPVRDFDSYLLNFLFPSMADHPCRTLATEPEPLDRGLEHFDMLLSNKQFLTIFIRVLEDQKSFGVRDRVNVASLLCLAFVNRPDYLTDITLSLVGDLALKSAEKKHPKLMLRRTESVAERLLSNWLSLVLYQWVSEKLSGPLYTLYRALKHQLEKGPIDAITYEAKYSLSEEKLLKENVNYKVISVNVRVLVDQIRHPFITQCRLLSCDSIGQAKSKVLDHLIYTVANSRYWGLKADDIDLLWNVNADENVLLSEADNSSSEAVHSPSNFFLSATGTLGKGGTFKSQGGDCNVVHLNTLASYGIDDSATLMVVHRLTGHHPVFTVADTHSSGAMSTTSTDSQRSPGSPRLSSAAALLGTMTISVTEGDCKEVDIADPNCRFLIPNQQQCPPTRQTTVGSLRRYCSLRASSSKTNRWDGKQRQDSFPSHSRSVLHPTQRVRYVHLVQPNDFRSNQNLTATTASSSSKQQSSCRNIPEIYLTRLLTTKGTLQKYVDDLFEAIFDCSSGNCPPAIRYLYARLDDLAVKLGPAVGGDPAEVAYTWKCNSLPLRFLVNLIKNPDFALDVEKPPAVDSSLSVLGQLLMDACSTSEYRLGKDSPTNKLLFAREISRYRSMVQTFMHSAQQDPCYDQAEALQDFASLGISTGTTSQLSRRSAVLELYKYSVRYHMEILEALESQISTRSFVNHLTQQAHSPSQRSEESSSPSTASSNLLPPNNAINRQGYF